MSDKNYIEKVRQEYSPKETSKIDELRALDRKVKRTPTIFAYIYGVVSCLVLGVGMCLAMNIIGNTLVWMIVGIAVGIVGIAGVSSTYPIYQKMITTRKQRYSKEIIELSNQLLNKD